MVFIVAEKKNPDSKYKNFLDTLPVSYETFPEMYTEEEMEWIKGSPLYRETVARKNYHKESYKQICELCPELKDIGSENDFLSARILVKSRVFGIEVDIKDTIALVPVADMLNHDSKC